MFKAVLNLLSYVVFIGVSIYSYYFMRKVAKEGIDGPLTKDEKVTVIITLVLNTLFSFIIYYLGWKDKLPQKAQQVKSYLWKIILALVIVALLSFGIAVLLAVF